MIKVLNKVGDITGNDLFNASTANPIKKAGSKEISGKMTGCAVVQKTDDETGEISVSSVIKLDGELYAGASKVITNRIQELIEFMGEEVIKNGVEIQFCEIETKSGTGVSFILK